MLINKSMNSINNKSEPPVHWPCYCVLKLQYLSNETIKVYTIEINILIIIKLNVIYTYL